MSSFAERLRRRAAEVAERAAAGSGVPAGTVEEKPEAADRPSVRERGLMRRRMRLLRQKREAMLADLGGLVYEQHRREHPDPELVRRKAAELRAVDEEAKALENALGLGESLAEVAVAGIAGRCESCQAILGTEEAYCSRCGTARDARAAAKAGTAGDTGADAVADPPSDSADTTVLASADSEPAAGEPAEDGGGNGKAPRESERAGDEAEKGNGQAAHPDKGEKPE